MSLRVTGAILIVLGCGGFGFSMASSYRRTERDFLQYLSALDIMDSELSYRSPPLPQLCIFVGNSVTGTVREFFLALADELNHQVAPDVQCCIQAAVIRTPGLPESLTSQLMDLGLHLGRFDLPGQLRGIRSAHGNAKRILAQLQDNKNGRLRSYQTLGLCMGAALAILFL